MGERCCCGKYADVGSSGFISNKTQHMPINTGSFCGPVDHHTIAALRNRVEELREVIRATLHCEQRRLYETCPDECNYEHSRKCFASKACTNTSTDVTRSLSRANHSK